MARKRKAKGERMAGPTSELALSATPVPMASEAPAQPPVLLTAQQEKEGGQRFAAEVDRIVQRYQSTIATILATHWETGKFVDSLVVQPGHWGNVTVEKLAESLAGRLKAGGISPASLYAYRQLFNVFPSQEDVRKLANLNIPWWVVNRMLPWTKEARDEFIAAYPNLDTKKVAEWIDDRSKELPEKAGKKAKVSDGHKIRAALSVYDAIGGICADLNSRMNELGKADKIWQEDEDKPRQGEFAKKRKDMIKALESTGEHIKIVLARLEEKK